MSDRPAGAVEGALENGLRYTLWPDERDTVATLHVWTAVGTCDEAPGASGIAHMLEHMMFRGTPAVPDGAFDARVEALGVSVNAFTWHDHTTYTSTGPAECLPVLLELEADRFANLAVSPEAFSPERDVVANERRQMVDAVPDALLSEAFHAALFDGTPYAWPTIGWAEDIAAYTADALRAFHRARYVGSNVHVVAVGNFDAAAIEAEIARTFASLPAGEARPERHRETPERARVRQMSLPVSSGRLLMGWRSPERSASTFPVWVVFEELFSAAESSRIARRLEIDDRLTLDTSSVLYAFAGAGAWELSSVLRAGVSADAVAAAVQEELELLAKEGPDARELEGALARVRTSLRAGLADTGGRAELLGESRITTGDAWAGLRLDAQLLEVTPDDVRSLAGQLASTPPVVYSAEPT